MYLYIIGNSTDRQKIGFSADVEKRLKSLQTGNPDKLFIHHKILCNGNHREMERKIHNELSYKRLSGEWFNLTPEEASNYLEFAKITWLDSYLLT